MLTLIGLEICTIEIYFKLVFLFWKNKKEKESLEKRLERFKKKDLTQDWVMLSMQMLLLRTKLIGLRIWIHFLKSLKMEVIYKEKWEDYIKAF